MSNTVKENLERTSKGIKKARAAEPIKDMADIEKIKKVLNTPKTKKYYVLFMTGLYSLLRISDILLLTANDVKDGKIEIHERKTHKAKTISINPRLQLILDDWMKENNLQGDDYIFFANRRDGSRTKPIDKSQAYRKIQEAVIQAKVKVHYSNHTLRKTGAYHAYINNGKDITLVSYALNHSSATITRRYIGLDQESVDIMYNNADFGI